MNIFLVSHGTTEKVSNPGFPELNKLGKEMGHNIANTLGELTIAPDPRMVVVPTLAAVETSTIVGANLYDGKVKTHLSGELIVPYVGTEHAHLAKETLTGLWRNGESVLGKSFVVVGCPEVVTGLINLLVPNPSGIDYSDIVLLGTIAHIAHSGARTELVGLEYPRTII